MWNLQTISPSDLTVPSPNSYIHIYKDDDESFSHPQNSVPPIDIAIATSSLNTRGPSSSDSTTPSLLSPSHPGYASSPSLMNVTPPTPAHSLGPVSDVYHTFPPSAPVSPYSSQRSPWPISSVRILSFILPRYSQQFPPIASIHGTRACPSIQRASTGPHGATEAVQAAHLQR
jgi:hypothetical protein